MMATLVAPGAGTFRRPRFESDVVIGWNIPLLRSSLCLPKGGWKRISHTKGERDEGLRSTVASLVGQGLQLVHELLDILELPIHGCKPDIRNLVQLMQLFHDFLAHHSAFDLRFA